MQEPYCIQGHPRSLQKFHKIISDLIFLDTVLKPFKANICLIRRQDFWAKTASIGLFGSFDKHFVNNTVCYYYYINLLFF